MNQTQAMTQAEYARHRKTSRQYISRLAGRGILVIRGKLVDVAASDAVLDDKPVDVEPPESAARSTGAPVDGGAARAGSFAQARTSEMI